MTSIRVRGMTCEGCESVVETAVSMLDGVEEVSADRYENIVEVSGDVGVDDVAAKVELAGYRALGEATDEDDEAASDEGTDAAEAATETSDDEEPVGGADDDAEADDVDELEE